MSQHVAKGWGAYVLHKQGEDNEPGDRRESQENTGPQLANAASLLLPDIQLDAIMYSCTSGTIAMGYEEVERQLNSGRHKVPVVTPITAAMTAFRALSIKSISMLTPYIDSVNQPMRKFIMDHGVDVPYLNSFLYRERRGHCTNTG